VGKERIASLGPQKTSQVCLPRGMRRRRTFSRFLGSLTVNSYGAGVLLAGLVYDAQIRTCFSNAQLKTFHGTRQTTKTNMLLFRETVLYKSVSTSYMCTGLQIQDAIPTIHKHFFNRNRQLMRARRISDSF